MDTKPTTLEVKYDELTPESLPQKIKNVTHLLSILVPSSVSALLLLMASGTLFRWQSLLMFPLSILILSVFVFLYYLLAGGMDWKNKKLSRIRIALFWILGDLMIGFYLYFQWVLIRLIVAKAYKIPLPLAMGRLLATREKTYIWPVNESEKGVVCEKCGTRTQIGRNYTFVCGDKISTSTTYEAGGAGILKVSTTKYRISESNPVYLCNKCVILKKERELAEFFKKALVVVLAMLVIFYPLGIALNNIIYILPLMVLVFGGPVAFFHKISLMTREYPPSQAYSILDLYKNPPYSQYLAGFFSSKPDVISQGEKLAITIKKPSLSQAGVDAFFTHEEAKARLKRTH